MRAMIYRSSHATAELTTESSSCSYGIPVLRMKPKGGGAEDFGPHDVLPSGVFAVTVVTNYRDGADLTASGWGGRWIKSKAGTALAERFIQSSPPLPQKIEDLRIGDSIPRSSLSDEASRVLDGEESE